MLEWKAGDGQSWGAEVEAGDLLMCPELGWWSAQRVETGLLLFVGGWGNRMNCGRGLCWGRCAERRVKIQIAETYWEVFLRRSEGRRGIAV